MHIELQRHDGTPLWRQIALTLSDRIRSGLLESGTRLPSVRELARSLKVSQVTVSKAYAELERMELIRCTQGKGCFVGPEPDAGVHHPELSASWQLAAVDYLPRAQTWRHFQGSSSECRYQLHVAEVEARLLPNREICRNIQQLVAENPEIIGNYGPFQGDAQLRSALAGYFRECGIAADAGDVLIASGSQQAIDLVARTFVGPGDTVYLEGPTYSGAIDVFAARGARIITVPVDREGMRLDVLSRLCDVHPPKLIYTVPTFHNPTGAVMSAPRRARLLELAQSHGAIILEDDAFSDIWFRTEPPRAIKALDRSGHVILTKGFSKILSPGCRVSAIVASGSILSRLIAAKTIADLGSPMLNQRAILPVLKSGLFRRHLKRLRTALKARRDLVLELMKRHAPPGVTWTEPDGGFNLWVTMPEWARSTDLYLLAQREGVAILPGIACYANEPELHRFRLSYSYMDESSLREAVILLCDVLRRYLAHPSPKDADSRSAL
jgi:DNA-binding transcriptional MocR family regulator